MYAFGFCVGALHVAGFGFSCQVDDGKRTAWKYFSWVNNGEPAELSPRSPLSRRF